jgi:thermostable 8-oxoguanine DNA glycosylase
MNIIKNYKVLKETVEEFPCIKIREDEDVFAELPICLCKYGVEYREPILFVGQQGQIPIVLEKEELIEKIKGTRIFFLKLKEDNTVEEVDKEDSHFSYRLPIDTPVDKLMILNGELGLVENKGDDN